MGRGTAYIRLIKQGCAVCAPPARHNTANRIGCETDDIRYLHLHIFVPCNSPHTFAMPSLCGRGGVNWLFNLVSSSILVFKHNRAQKNVLTVSAPHISRFAFWVFCFTALFRRQKKTVTSKWERVPHILLVPLFLRIWCVQSKVS